MKNDIWHVVFENGRPTHASFKIGKREYYATFENGELKKLGCQTDLDEPQTQTYQTQSYTAPETQPQSFKQTKNRLYIPLWVLTLTTVVLLAISIAAPIEEYDMWPYWLHNDTTSWNVRNPNLDEINITLSGEPKHLLISTSNNTQVLVGIMQKSGNPVVMKTNGGVYDSSDWAKMVFSVENVVDQTIISQTGSPLAWSFNSGTGKWDHNFDMTIYTIHLPFIQK